MPSSEQDWQLLAGDLLKAHLALAGVKYPDLVRRLEALGFHQNVSNVSRKLKAGSFSAAFLMQVLVAIDVDRLELPRRSDH